MWRQAIRDELRVGELRLIELEGKPLLIGRTEKGYFAVLDRCSHENQPLSEADGISGRIFKGLLECPHHGAKFDPHTGQAKGLPAIRPIKTFPVKVENGYVWVEL